MVGIYYLIIERNFALNFEIKPKRYGPPTPPRPAVSNPPEPEK